MEEDLMLWIKNDLCEMKHNGFDITDIEMYNDLEMNLVISYKYGGQKYVIRNEEV